MKILIFSNKNWKGIIILNLNQKFSFIFTKQIQCMKYTKLIQTILMYLRSEVKRPSKIKFTSVFTEHDIFHIFHTLCITNYFRLFHFIFIFSTNIAFLLSFFSSLSFQFKQSYNFIKTLLATQLCNQLSNHTGIYFRNIHIAGCMNKILE